MTRITLSPSMQKPATVAVFRALEAAGGKACVRFVGGCVRNALLGRDESDLDLSTQLTPDQVEAALEAAGIKHVPTGKVFGTITAVVGGEPYEITSLREDVETDGRRAVVSFTTNWAKDAVRRDFYINALYADLSGRVYDPTGHGLEDAKSKRVRFIGEAEQRIREDYLRILRFFRFTASYASIIDAPSLAACVALKDGIDGLSGERISLELLKLLAVENPVPVLQQMIDTGIMDHVLKGGRWSAKGLLVTKAMVALTPEVPLRLAALVSEANLLNADGLAALQQQLRFSNALVSQLKAIGEVVGALPSQMMPEDRVLWRALIYRHGPKALESGLWLMAATQGFSTAQANALIAQTIGANPVPVFKLKGADLIKRGLEAGPEVGERLKAIEAEWIAHDFSQSVIDKALDALPLGNKK